MWLVQCESLSIEKEISKMILSGQLSIEDRHVISLWIRQISFYGPDSVRGNKKWADHALVNEWVGYRSSAFSNKGRIIYRIENKLIKILIAKITNTHDYRK